jgi:hypothetical protein
MPRNWYDPPVDDGAPDPFAIDRPVKVIGWRPNQGENPRLVGHCDISFDGIIVLGIPIFLSDDGTLGAGTPATPWMEGGRQKVLAGRPRWNPMIDFADLDARDRWQTAIRGALEAHGVKP